MTQDSQPGYPRTPAYGQGYRPGGAGPRTGATWAGPVGTPPPPAVPPPPVWPSVGLSVAVNLLSLVGVLALHWPVGNVFLLLWVENLVLGLATLVRIGTAQRSASGQVRTALFFCGHYGLFCVVHLAFAAFVALRLGAGATLVLLGPPVALVVVRHVVELATTWFGPRGLRRRTTPGQAMGAPYVRTVILQVGVMGAFALVLVGFVSHLPDSPWSAFDRAVSVLPGRLGRPEVLLVVVLLLVKFLVDVVTTRRALRVR